MKTDRSKKWWKSMVAIHGSEAAVREYMRQNAAKSSRNKEGKGGFAAMPTEKVKELSKKANNTRWNREV